MSKEKKSIEYYKANAEEDYATVPISVLRYITELEEKNKEIQQQIQYLNEVVENHNNSRDELQQQLEDTIVLNKDLNEDITELEKKLDSYKKYKSIAESESVRADNIQEKLADIQSQLILSEKKVELNFKFAKAFEKQLAENEKELSNATTMLGKIHDIVDKQNFDEDSQLHEIYKITHNSF